MIEIYYNIVTALCFGFLAMCHVESYLPDQGLNLHPLRWKTKSQPLAHQGSP